MIDTRSNTVTATIAVGRSPIGVAFTPNGRYAYVTDCNANTVSVIDTRIKAVTAAIARRRRG